MPGTHREIFTQKMLNVAAITHGKFSMTLQQRSEIISKLKAAHGRETCRKPKDYRLLQRFDILTTQGEEKLIEKLDERNETDFRYVVAAEELYDLLNDKHNELQHGGRDRMIKELSKRYCNITQQAISLFLSYCSTCQLKKKTFKKGLVVKPIVSNELNSRCQVDLIDMQSQPAIQNGQVYRFILNYQDHLTKFIQLRPLKTKTAAEVVQILKEIFAIFGAPHILQSDNGREFVAKVIQELLKQWPGCRMVHGKPRHSQSQGSVERANQDVQHMIFAWVSEHQNTNWVDALPEVQFAKNRSFHRGIGRAPYKAMFGAEPRLGILSSKLPPDIVHNIQTEEEFEQAWTSVSVATGAADMDVDMDVGNESDDCYLNLNLSEIEANEATEIVNGMAGTSYAVLQPIVMQCCVCAKPYDGSHSCATCRRPVHVICGQVDPDNEGYGCAVVCNHCVRQQTADLERIAAKQSQEKQAEKMVQLSNKRFEPVHIGQSVIVGVPNLDRGRTDARNVMAVVMDQSDGFYTLGTKHGVLQRKYVRSEISHCTTQFLATEEVPQAEISLREAAGKDSLTGGQGYARCNCKKNCQTAKCSCKVKGNLCNSNCHGSSSCCNK